MKVIPTNQARSTKSVFHTGNLTARAYMCHMPAGYDQFCPVAKAAEIFATRWTPLILRELLSGAHSFNDIVRGIPLISRAVLVTRFSELERLGIVERRPLDNQSGHAYWLTSAGDDFRSVIDSLGRWGLHHTFNRIEPSDLDPALLIFGLGKRISPNELPQCRVVVRFEFSGVPATRTKFRIMWLVLAPSGIDVCIKDPGFAIDLFLRGKIRDWVAVYLGHVTWSDFARTSLQMEGDAEIGRNLPVWLKLVTVCRDNGGFDPAASMQKTRADVSARDFHPTLDALLANRVEAANLAAEPLVSCEPRSLRRKKRR